MAGLRWMMVAARTGAAGFVAAAAIWAVPAGAALREGTPEEARDTPVQAAGIVCLATAIYFEARGEPMVGQLAVGRVILNRVESKVYPDTICGVVYQNADHRNACQFSFACDGNDNGSGDVAAWRAAMRRATQLVTCEIGCPATDTGRSELWTSTHFHADYVSPSWAQRLQRIMSVGRHIFYLERPA